MRLALPSGFPTEVHVLNRPTADLLPSGPWVLVGDEAVRGHWQEAGLPEPAGSRWVEVSEAGKRLSALEPWLEAWAQVPLHRDATVVAVGGGVLTDMAGLAASLYMRGIKWQCWPTTLLSMVDAGLGGKTACDLEAGKNLVGAFHSPERLVACTRFLDTLPARQIESGRWELVKTAVLLNDLAWAQELVATDAPRSAWIERALAFKSGVVNRDPEEHGERRLLNLGHTLGHAIESASGYQLLHGESVGLGLLAACLLAPLEGLKAFPQELLQSWAERLAPLADRVAEWEELLPWLRRDKKGLGEAIACVLPRPDGPALIRPLPPGAWAEPTRLLRECLAGSLRA
ncbi:MAG TPA: 3-dehydroquinate synthase family protein [Holophagaceae bacterium]|nr:3-dehydroquinate synthase family protein [Holophagaceae bacterium]